ncbi:MAG: ATP-binding protein [Gammaproteobacteria bacterium]|nr:ATP-binding protein [Gammaproteobacteria bacterium]
MTTGDSHLVSIVGPESTGKTTLARELASVQNGVWLPEYAREFLADIHYTEKQVHDVAHEQLHREQDFVRAKPRFGVLDTDGVVLRIWFEEKFGYVPDYIDRHLEHQVARTYLLTYPDLPWAFDPQRESKTDLPRLFKIYERVLYELKFDFSIVQGTGRERVRCAIDCLQMTGVICDH